MESGELKLAIGDWELRMGTGHRSLIERRTGQPAPSVGYQMSGRKASNRWKTRCSPALEFCGRVSAWMSVIIGGSGVLEDVIGAGDCRLSAVLLQGDDSTLGPRLMDRASNTHHSPR